MEDIVQSEELFLLHWFAEKTDTWPPEQVLGDVETHVVQITRIQELKKLEDVKREHGPLVDRKYSTKDLSRTETKLEKSR